MPNITKRNTRQELISWQRHQLFMPRFQMSLLLLLTGIISFLSSFLLLHWGIVQMWLRYPLAIMLSYAAFLVMVRMWLAFQLSQSKFDFEVHFDLPINGGSGDATAAGADFSFGGQSDFGGGGAGGGWEDGVSSFSSSSSGADNSSILDGFSVDVDLQELGLLILAAAALLGGLFASLYVVYIAPVLLAEIVIDGLLLSSLSQRVKQIERKHWLHTALSKTLPPALVCALFFAAAGGALQVIAPEAKTIGEVWSLLASSGH